MENPQATCPENSDQFNRRQALQQVGSLGKYIAPAMAVLTISTKPAAGY